MCTALVSSGFPEVAHCVYHDALGIFLWYQVYVFSELPLDGAIGPKSSAILQQQHPSLYTLSLVGTGAHKKIQKLLMVAVAYR
mmetsp:Transcript_42795/g.76879  ORF Transcript_42795/g.76879 Transcript_42795/m.76879 type:complete len:83 (-) Transcript_42795:443-691(-)